MSYIENDDPQIQPVPPVPPKGNGEAILIPMPATNSTSKYATRSGFGVGTAVRAFTPVLLGKSRTYMVANCDIAQEVTLVDAAKGGAMGKDLYAVTPEAVDAGALIGITTEYDALMVPLVDRDEIAYLWEIRRLNRDGIQLPSYDAAMRVLEGTEEKPGLRYTWGRIVFQNRNFALDNAPKPDFFGEPKWPAKLKTFDDWVEAAFPGKIIRDPEHKILRRLRGLE
jgi:hypothetical protein